jgi:hypothetical protein
MSDVTPPPTVEAIRTWTYRVFGISEDRQLAAEERIASWHIPHVERHLSPAVSADRQLASVFLVESIDTLVNRGVPETKLLSKLRGDPDLWPTWAELRAAGQFAFHVVDAELRLEADRARGRHADFTFARDDEIHAIEFKAIGMSDREVSFCQSVAPALPGLLPRKGVLTMHLEDTETPANAPREFRRQQKREAERQEKYLYPTARGIAAACVVGHGTERAYVQRLASRFREAFDQLPEDQLSWVAFHWSNGAPRNMIARTLAEVDRPPHVVGVCILGSVAIPGGTHNFLMWFPAPFSTEGEEEWHSDAGVEEAKGLLSAIDASCGLRPTYIRVPWQGQMIDFLKRTGESRIHPCNILLSPDPPDLLPGRDSHG